MSVRRLRGFQVHAFKLFLFIALAQISLFVTGVCLCRPAHAAAPPKRIYIANDEHTDYFWTADDLAYRQAFIDMLNFYMTQAEQTAGNPPDTRGRFNMDGTLWLWEYEHNNTPAAYQRLIGHLRGGSLSLPLQTCVSLYGAMPAEAVLRNMYYAGRIERREGLRFPLVVAMENQTLPGGVASLWAGSGAKYSWKGICGCATQINAAIRPREIYHFAGPDGASVCLKWNSMTNGNQSIGGYAEAFDPAGAVTFMDSNAGYLSRWPWAVSGGFGFGWDALQTTTGAFISTATSASNATRRVIVSNETDFFTDFLANYGGQIPTFSGSFGNEWDLLTASMGEVTAGFKRGVEKLRTGEALATVATLFDPTFMAGRAAPRDSAFMACGLYYEHDWTADGLVARTRRAQFQRDQLAVLNRYVDRLQADGLTALGGRVPAGALERHVVFNPLGWTRSDVADLTTNVAPPLRVVDLTTGLDIPSQVMSTAGPTSVVRIRADGVPAVGYRVFEVRAGTGTNFPNAATVTLPTFDNGTYGVTLGGRGQITSVVDHKDANRQLVDAAGIAALNDLGSGSGTVTLESNGPVSATLKVGPTGTPAHTVRVTLYSGIDRIDINDGISQNFNTNVGYASRFNLAGATIRHEEVGMIATVGRAAAGGDYADQNARTDYLTMNHFVDLSTATRGVTLSNWDSGFFQVGNSTPTTLDVPSTQIRAVVGMQVDGPALGIQNQGGDTAFLNRYALRTHGAYQPADAMRFSVEHQNPFVVARATGAAGAPLPATNWGLVTMSNLNVLLWALKPAEEGSTQGTIARFWNPTEGAAAFTFAMPAYGFVEARRTTHIETDLGAATVVGRNLQDTLVRQQMATYRLFPITTAVPDEGALTPSPLRVTPNPVLAGAAVSLRFTLPRAGAVRLEIFDVSGRLLATPLDAVQDAGEHLAHWTGRDGLGQRVAPGVYFARVAGPGLARTEKIVVIR